MVDANGKAYQNNLSPINPLLLLLNPLPRPAVRKLSLDRSPTSALIII
jgi:hypothetical protein